MLVTTLGDLVLDVIVQLEDELVPGDDRPALTRAGAGGQAANVAAWVVASGASARFVGKRGRELGVQAAADGCLALLLETLAKEGAKQRVVAEAPPLPIDRPQEQPAHVLRHVPPRGRPPQIASRPVQERERRRQIPPQLRHLAQLDPGVHGVRTAPSPRLLEERGGLPAHLLGSRQLAGGAQLDGPGVQVGRSNRYLPLRHARGEMTTIRRRRRGTLPPRTFFQVPALTTLPVPLASVAGSNPAELVDASPNAPV